METLKYSDLPSEELKVLKKLLIVFEEKLGRKTNLIDIIGEIEVCCHLKYDLVKDGINAGFDAVDGEKRIQIKSTRSPVDSGRVSAIMKDPKNPSCGFDFIILARYDRSTTIRDIYCMSSANCLKFFSYINSTEKASNRKNTKLYKDISIGQFISWSEKKYDFASSRFVTNGEQKYGQKETINASDIESLSHYAIEN